ncbi:DUF2461 domain-containing protein [Umezawaea beigongshangensis]|uniref:DUF2461 domain-containing protein n=1 Tax=Umezawaea beigongshangensis TaxID=2780383 RepID=UPI0018F16583|nr:DUF2461 domain-containing protein [Umezawaea beigongshangensis]
MTFSGFGEYAVDFYDGLNDDNSKAYWDDHRETYQRDVRAPMEALLAELEPEFGEGKVFRPYRDVRFAKDKTPYKTHCGAVVELGRGGGAYYVEVSSDGLRVAGGSFHMEADQLARYRTSVDDERRGEELRKILAKLTGGGWEVLGNQLKSKPRGFDLDHPRIDLLRHRTIYAARVWEPDDALHERESLDRVRRAWRQVRTFNDWCADHVGVSAPRPPRG